MNGLLDEATRLAGWAGVSASRGWPTLSAALGDDVRRLSDAYNQSGHAPARWDPGLQAARLLFFLPRDVLKTAAWARDAARAAPTRPLRVLDLGAGLGATSIGFADALRAVAAADQAFAGGGFLGLLLAHLDILDARRQHAHGRGFVGVLRAAVLAFRDDAGG